MTTTTALARQTFQPGDTTSTPFPITSGPTSLGVSFDATGYVDGSELTITLRVQQTRDAAWEEYSATIEERGQNLDGTPRTAWGATVTYAAPLPDTTWAQVTLSVDAGPGLVSEATLQWL